MRSKLVFQIVSVAILLWNCSTTFTITLTEDDETPIADIKPLILDDNGEDILIDNMRTDADGKLSFNLSEIPGDSFLVSVETDNYFNKQEWINPFSGKKTREIILSQRVTTITGVVLDDYSYLGVPNCNVSTSPAIMQTTKTDSSGFFQLQSKQFANISYVILFDKPPEYESNTTNIKPLTNEIISLKVPIYLVRKKDDDDMPILEGNETINLPGDLSTPKN
ncbi:MAG: hypothetical protein HOM08_12525 [Candidatus Marinimicrobia bacterium]|jgi:hypothetical protein|nr:hypothetical protein [Candidatus Neomarinimicrobiota bacterium]